MECPATNPICRKASLRNQVFPPLYILCSQFFNLFHFSHFRFTEESNFGDSRGRTSARFSSTANSRSTGNANITATSAEHMKNRLIYYNMHSHIIIYFKTYHVRTPFVSPCLPQTFSRNYLELRSKANFRSAVTQQPFTHDGFWKSNSMSRCRAKATLRLKPWVSS
jgi:hypothetical protein